MKGLIASISVSAVLAAAIPAAAVAPSGGAVSPGERVAGKTHSQWLVSEWQSLLAYGHLDTEAPKGPLKCLTQGQPAKVWFLQDAYENDAPATVTCTIPAGRYLFLEGPGFECSTVEPAPYHATRARLPACAASFKLKGDEVSVDGAPVAPASYAVATPVFRFTMPSRGNVLKVTGRTRGYSAAHGDVLMLRPLAPGAHTIVQVAHYASGISTQTTWQLTVG